MDWIERIAAEMHQVWMELYVEREGEEAARQHPHFRSWEELRESNDDVEAMSQDRFVAALVLRGFACGDAVKEEDLRALIHDSVQLWIRLSGEERKDYHVPYAEANKRAVREREAQAPRVWNLLQDMENVEELRLLAWIPGRKN